MNNKIITYYIPTNPNNQKGSIYTLYINNNTNLDLTSIMEENVINKQKENNILVESQKYNKLIEINNKIEQLINKINDNLKIYNDEENKNIIELNKLNIEYKQIINSLVSERIL